MTIALVTTNPVTVLQEFGVPPPVFSVPGLGDVHGADVGWTSPDGAYMLATLIKFVPPQGQSSTGDPSYTLSSTTVTETYATTPTPPLAPQEAAAVNYGSAIAAGIILTWSSSTTLNGTYAIDDRTMARLNSIWTVLLGNSAFPNNKTRQPWPLMSGAQVTFSAAQFRLFGTALSNYLAALDEARVAQAGGGNPTWPSSAVSVTG